jgi:hypothetical protein
MKGRSWGRLWGVLAKPGETFASIAERPTWGVALAVLVLASAAATLVMFARVDFAEMMRQQMAAQHQQLPAGFESRMGLIKGCSEVAAVAIPAIVPLVVAAVFLVFNLLGGRIDYRTSLAVTVHAAMPQVVKALLTIPIAFYRGSLTMAEVQAGLLRSNLAFLAPQGAGRPLVALLASLDLFALWNLVLLAIGYRIAAKVSRTTAAVTVVLLWAVLVGIAVGFSALGGGMSGRGAPG